MITPKVLIIEETPAEAARLSAIIENREYQVIDIASFADRNVETIKEQMPELILIPLLFGENIDNIQQAKKIASRYLVDRVGTERQLKQANIEIQSILASLVNFLIGVSAKDKITHWNKAAEMLFIISADEIIGQSIMMCNIKWDWERIYEGITETITEDVPVRLTDVQFTDLNGKDAFLEITINGVKESDGRLRGFLLTGEDITKRKQLEIAAMLSQIGCVTVPEEIISKVYNNKQLLPVEIPIFLSHTKVGPEIIANIPRLKPISKIIAYQEKYYNGKGFLEDNISGDSIPFGARVLKIMLDYDSMNAGMGKAETYF